jgi:hypothetical protein
MSLYINIEKVYAVCVGNRWTQIEEGSFDLDSYEFQHDDNLLHGGGQGGLCATGFRGKVIDDPIGGFIQGPLTALQGVRTSE